MVEGSTAMRGKICLVTGGTRGIGQQTALRLARMGAQLVIVGRSSERINNTLTALRAAGGTDRFTGIQADLSSMAGVRHVAEVFQDRYGQLDLLVNNVGATLLKYQSSPEGFEMTWALNYLGHFLLTHLLLGSLIEASKYRGEARILEITSSMLRLANPRFPRLQSAAGYNGVFAYAQSKLAINMYTREMARRLAGTDVTINAITPGAVRTDIAVGNGLLAGLAKQVVNFFSSPIDKGVEPVLHLALSPVLCGVSGGYYRLFKQMPIPAAWDKTENTTHLWQMSESMTGLRSSLSAD